MNIKTIGKKIITFYSYKGGVGRTQLLANLAAFFCFYRNKRILVLDWDLEAPGLHFYFGIEKEQIQKGTIDLFQSYVDMVRSSEKGLNESEMPYFDESYILPTHYRTEKGGKIDLISAGKQDENFSNKVNDFGWQHFYKNLDGAAYIEVLKTKLKELDYDYIFVDSRTGINDYSGICNIQFPDINVIIAAPNYQNLNGSLEICKKITESPYMKLEINGIPIRKPLIYPILSRLDLSEDTNSSEWILRFSREFDSYIQKTFKLQSLKISSKDFVEETNIYYVKELSYKETIVFKEEDQEENFSGIKDQFQQLSKFLLDERAITQTKFQQEQSQNQQIDSSEPKNEAEAYLNMGRSFFFLGKHEEAKEQYLKAIEIESNSYVAWHNLGVIYSESQNYEEAINCYKKVIEIKEDTDAAWTNLGTIYKNLQNYEEAINCHKKAIEIKPDFHEAWSNLGVAYDKLQNIEEAINCHKRAIKIKPDFYEAWNNLAIIYFKLENYEEIIKTQKKMIKLKPDDYEAWYHLGITYNKLKDYTEAVNCYTNATKIKPNYYEAWFNLGAIYSNLQNREKAIHCYKKVIEIKSDDYEARYNLGLTYSELENHEEAINFYKKSIEVKEDFYDAWNNLGTTYSELQNYEEAIKAYKKAITINSDNYIVWFNLGTAYFNLKNYEEAEKCYNKTLEINPNYESAFYNLACFYSSQNEKQKSISHLEKAISLNPNYKSDAKQDEDFKNLWQDKDFLALVGE